MSTNRPDDQLDEIRRRIDALEAKAQAGGLTAKDSIRREIEALRRDASTPAVPHAAQDAHASETPHGDPSKDKYLSMETRLGTLENELAAELARGPGEGRSRAGA